MTAKILNGKLLAESIRQNIKNQIVTLKSQGKRVPGIAVILVGEDEASKIYVHNKQLACQEVGILSQLYSLEATISEQKLLSLIQALNQNPDIDGILVQLPLPPQINSQRMNETIHPHKDVDGFHPLNIGRLIQQKPLFHPCTPHGIMLLLNSIDMHLKGKHATVVGVSTIVGLPMILELIMAGCTVTACRRSTNDLKKQVLEADILVSATGSPHLIKGDWIKPNAVVIDVGIHRLNSGKLVGDVEFDKAIEKASYITPVPNGVGPMTIASLLQNTFMAYHINNQLPMENFL